MRLVVRRDDEVLETAASRSSAADLTAAGSDWGRIAAGKSVHLGAALEPQRAEDGLRDVLGLEQLGWLVGAAFGPGSPAAWRLAVRPGKTDSTRMPWPLTSSRRSLARRASRCQRREADAAVARRRSN
jgi:hypothetical protein